jgi:hypothetical protein
MHNFLYLQLLHIKKKTKIPSCFDPQGIIISESVNQVSLHKMLKKVMYQLLNPDFFISCRKQ